MEKLHRIIILRRLRPLHIQDKMIITMTVEGLDCLSSISTELEMDISKSFAVASTLQQKC